MAVNLRLTVSVPVLNATNKRKEPKLLWASRSFGRYALATQLLHRCCATFQSLRIAVMSFVSILHLAVFLLYGLAEIGLARDDRKRQGLPALRPVREFAGLAWGTLFWFFWQLIFD